MEVLKINVKSFLLKNKTDSCTKNFINESHIQKYLHLDKQTPSTSHTCPRFSPQRKLSHGQAHTETDVLSLGEQDRWKWENFCFYSGGAEHAVSSCPAKISASPLTGKD